MNAEKLTSSQFNRLQQTAVTPDTFEAILATSTEAGEVESIEITAQQMFFILSSVLDLAINKSIQNLTFIDQPGPGRKLLQLNLKLHRHKRLNKNGSSNSVGPGQSIR
jgi:hypothetical protein